MPMYFSDGELSPSERQQLREIMHWFRSLPDDQEPVHPTTAGQRSELGESTLGGPRSFLDGSSSWESVGGDGSTTSADRFVLRMGGGSCVHKAHCHHTRRMELTPTRIPLCGCIESILRRETYYLDWTDMLHQNLECNKFVGRQTNPGTHSVKTAKTLFQVCSQCHW